jgi:hypothetical protein
MRHASLLSAVLVVYESTHGNAHVDTDSPKETDFALRNHDSVGMTESVSKRDRKIDMAYAV